MVLPEYFSVAGDPDFLRRHAEPLDGPTVSWASDLAERAGDPPGGRQLPRGRREPDGRDADRLFNTSCLIGPTGSIEAVYRKIHLFDVSLGGTGFHESATIAAGRRAVRDPARRADRSGTAVPMLGLSLCYDLRFPEIYRIMALLGATVMAVPAAFTAATGPAHWELLLRARAAENQVFVIGAGQVGELPPGMPACHGHSMIVDPVGNGDGRADRTRPGGGRRRSRRRPQQQIRSELPVLANRRPDGYRWPDDDSRGDASTTGRAAQSGGRWRRRRPASAPPFEVGIFDSDGVAALLRDPRPRSPGPRVHARDPDGLQHEPPAGRRPGRHRPPGDPARPARPRAVRQAEAGIVPPDGHLRPPRGGAARPPRDRQGRHRWRLPGRQREPAGGRPGPRPGQGPGHRDAGARVGGAGRGHHLHPHAAGRPLRPPAGQPDGLRCSDASPAPASARSTAP